MIENVVLVLGLILIGTIIRRVKSFPDSTAKVLNSFVLNISLPAIILISIPNIELSGAIFYPVLGHWFLYLVNIIFVLFFARLMTFSHSVTGVLIIVSCLGNTAFLGIPMIGTFLGEAAVPYAVLYDQMGSGIAFMVTAAVILPYFTGKKIGSMKNIFLNLLKFPPFIALFLGFVLKFYPLPSFFNHLLEGLSHTLIPCAMIAVGFQMKYRLERDKWMPIFVGLTIKLLLVPIVGIIIFNLFNLEHQAFYVSILQSGMPPMVTAGALAMSADLESDIAAPLVGYGLLFSFLSLSLLNILM